MPRRCRGIRGDEGIAPYEMTGSRPCVGADAYIRPKVTIPPSRPLAVTPQLRFAAQPGVHPKGTCFAARSDVGIRNLLTTDLLENA